MKYKIALIKGDGIGPEIVGSAVRVLQKAGEKFGHSFAFQEYLMGGCAIDASGTPLPEEGKELTALRAEVGMCFQSFNLFPHLTIRKNVTLGPTKVKGMDASEANALAEKHTVA